MRWLPPILLAVCLCSCAKKNKPADSAPEPNPPAPANLVGAPKPDVTALLRFWDAGTNEHVYTYGDGEPANWRRNGSFTSEHVVGYVAHKQLPETVPLSRAYCRDRRHYFYLTKPAGATDIERIEDFHLFVWTKPGDGRVPVHASFLADDKDAYFDQDLKRVKDYAIGAASGGKPRKVVENFFYAYPTGPAPSRPTVTPSSGGAKADWVVGLWIGQAGSRTVMVRYYPEGYFEETPTGASADAIHGTYTVRSGANQRLEIVRDVGGTVVPEFQGPVSMTHPIGASGERVTLRKMVAPKGDVSPLKQQPLAPEVEALRQKLVGRWKGSVSGAGGKQNQVFDYRADGTFTYTIAPTTGPERTVVGRWVVSGESKDPNTGKVYGLNLSRFVEGKMILLARMSFLGGTRISHPIFDEAEQAVFVREK